jgi:hypothetical protein
MDADDFEDMLFGAPDSQTFPDDFLIDDSDDEMLFPETEDEPMLLGLPDSTILTSTRTNTNTDGTSCGQDQVQRHPAVRDRY